MAYRGRALVELETTLGEVIEEPVGTIQGEEVIRAEVGNKCLNAFNYTIEP